MVSQLVERIRLQLLPELHRALGDRLEAVYALDDIYATYRQDRTAEAYLLFVFRELPDLGQLRSIFRSKLLPAVHPHDVGLALVDSGLLDRQQMLQPLLAEHLATKGRLLYGTPQRVSSDQADALDSLARLAGRAMFCSATLAPSMLPPRDYRELTTGLQRLAADVGVWHADSLSLGAERLVSEVEATLAARIRTASPFTWQLQAGLQAPPLIPDLLAIYEWDHGLLLILPDDDPDGLANLIVETDWDAVASRLAPQYRALRVTSPSQLRLVAMREMPADLVFENLEHAWGVDPLADLEVEQPFLLRDLARMPSEMEMMVVPQLFINAPDQDLPMLVHDLQNKLLNVQLRDELYRRFTGREAVAPPKTPTDRSATILERIEAVRRTCRWWAELYAQEMTLAQPSPG
jgi:hypothetical protein